MSSLSLSVSCPSSRVAATALKRASSSYPSYKNLDKTKKVIADICKLNNIQEKLVLLLQCILGRIQHLLAAVPMNLSRDFAKQHDEALFGAVAATLELGNLTDRDRLLMQRKVSNYGLGL